MIKNQCKNEFVYSSFNQLKKLGFCNWLISFMQNMPNILLTWQAQTNFQTQAILPKVFQPILEQEKQQLPCQFRFYIEIMQIQKIKPQQSNVSLPCFHVLLQLINRINLYRISMRIFINLADDSGLPRNIRMNLSNCGSTTALITEICRELGVKKTHTIISLKYQSYILRIVEGWPVEHYRVKNGSNFLVTFVEKYKELEISESIQPLLQISQTVDESFSQSSKNGQASMVSSKSEKDDQFFEDCLKRMLTAIRQGNLQKAASVLNEEIQNEDQYQRNQIFTKKHQYLLNQLGQDGKSALHESIQNGNVEIVSFLIIKGALPTVVTIDDFTPLQLAIINRSLEIASLLLQQKMTDINQNTSHGTALHLAISLSDAKAVQLLLKNEADLQITNSEGKKPAQICLDDKIKQLLKKKLSLTKIPTPTITMGDVFRVSTLTKRLKQRFLTLNPFKQQLIIQIAQKQIEYKLHLSNIQQIREVAQKSWLMSRDFFYLTILIKGQQENLITIALKNQKTYSKWLKNFKHTLKYFQNALFNKQVPASDQVVEVINDQKNEIVLRKRKVEPVKSNKMTMSIMNLRLSKNAMQPNFFESLTPSRSIVNNESVIGKQAFANESVLNQSTIILGSVLREDMALEKFANFDNQIEEVYEETFIEPHSLEKTSEQTPNNLKFRKNSEKVEYISQFKKDQKLSISFKEFQVIKMLGNGSFGKVFQAKYLKNGKIYALKVLNKKKLIAKKQLKYAVSQANILKKVNSPFIIKMYFAFQTPLNLYMAIDSCARGDLSQILIVRQKLGQSAARFVIAQLILAIQYLHSNRILYRDMKPQNILIADDGYIKLTDFGLSKQNNFSMSFCGSPAYLSPEMLEKKGVGFQCDIYGLGAVLFEMVVGDPPYFDEDVQVMFENIKNSKLKYPSHLSIQIKSLLSKLLERDPSKRLGHKDINQIKRHDFFKNIDWKALSGKRLKVPAQLFVHEDESGFQPVSLQSKQNLMIDDTEYVENDGMMSRVKNFTFIREEAEDQFTRVQIRQNPKQKSVN